MALLHLLRAWARKTRAQLPAVLIVDHGLRTESHSEAKEAAGWAKAQGFDAHVLEWKGAKPRANIEDAAREARYRLMGDWCRAHKVTALLVAHTEDDQAENFLLRLARGSGVDGLSAMAPEAAFPIPEYGDIKLLRPLLHFRRVDLRAYLAARKARWIEDPMNEDIRFARVRMRRLLPLLEAEGIPTSRIADASRHLARARIALEAQTESFFAKHLVTEDGITLVDGAALSALPREIALRVLSRVLTEASGQAYRPRFERLERLFAALQSGTKLRGQTLHGCKVAGAAKRLQKFGAETLAISPEPPRQAARKLYHAS